MSQAMLLKVQRHDGSTEELPVGTREQALAVFQSFDWESELARQRALRGTGVETCAVGLELMDDCGRRLFLSPINRGVICFNYVYQGRNSTYGFSAIESEQEHFVSSFPMHEVPALMSLHYESRHGEILRIFAQDGLPGQRLG